jgi:hypothetical protein
VISNLQRHTSSHKDPSSYVYKTEDGAIVRKIKPDVIQLLERHHQFTQIESIYSEPEQLYAVKKLPFLSYHYEYPFPLLKDMALFYLDTLEALLKDGYALSDGTPLNCTYTGKGKFEFFDIGSIVDFDKNKGWEGYRQFLVEFYLPLVYLADLKTIYPSALLPFINDSRWFLNVNFSLRQRYRLPNLLFQAFIRRSLHKSLDAGEKSKGTTISEQSVEKIITLLRSSITNTASKASKTKWDDYYCNTILKDDYLARKEAIFRALFDKAADAISSEATAIDWGANTGFFSTIIADHNNVKLVIAIESDHNAVAELYRRHKDQNIVPLHVSLFSPTPAVGFENNRESLLSRLSECADIQVALGLIHHMQHEQNLSYADIIRFFHNHSKDQSFLLVEYVDPADDRYQLIRNPNYPFAEGKDAFLNALQEYYIVIDSQQPISTRELFLAKKIQNEQASI